MTDEDERTLGAGRVDDGPQVVGELLDGAVLKVGGLRLAVAALVPEHDAVTRLDEGPALQHPAAQAEAEAVREHDRRQGGVEVLGGVHLDVEVEAVGRDDLELQVCRVGEAVRGVEGAEAAPGCGSAVRGQTGRGCARCGGGCGAEPDRLAHADHQASPPTLTRGSRLLMRVTIS